MSVTNEPTLNRTHDLEVSLELLSFAGGENTISEDHVCKADEARRLENWDSISLGGMERSKGFNKVADADAAGADDYNTLLLHMDGSDDGTDFPDSSPHNNTVTRVNAVTKTGVKKFGTASGYFDGTGDYLTVPSDQKLTNGSFETWTGLTNLLLNNDFETWSDASTCTNWSKTNCTSDREGTIKHGGTYSAKITSTGEGTEFFSGAITGTAGKTMVFGAWVYATDANSVRLFTTDAVGGGVSGYSAYHSGTPGWEYLTRVQTQGAGDNFRCELSVANGKVGYIDDAVCYEMLAPTGWTLGGAGATVTREEGTIKVGTYSAKLTRVGTDCSLSQQIVADDTYKSKAITFGAWVYASAAVNTGVILSINDGVDVTDSSPHSNSAGWEYLTVTKTCSASATELTVYCENGTTNGSVYFDGAFVTDDAVANFNFGSSAFTLDTWAYFTDVTTATSRAICALWSPTTADYSFILDWIQTTDLLRFIYWNGSTTIISTAWTPTINTWYHIEVVRSGNLLYFFVNGTLKNDGGTAITGTLGSCDSTFCIGASSAGNDYFIGYLDELRVSKGVARHTADFTPPTSPYRVAYAGSYDLLVQHDDVGGTETYGVIEGDLVKKASTRMDLEDSGAFTSGVLCHAVSVKDLGLYITNATDGLKVKTVGSAISVPADTPPTECARIYNHKNRLLAEGSASYPNRVYGSRVGKGNWDEADAWTLANDAFSIDLPEDTRGLVPDFPSGDYVLAFTEKNAYALGNFPNASFRAIGTPARGCSAPYSIAKGDEGVYFASTYPTKGIFLFDGTSFSELTELNKDVFTDKIDFTKRIFGIYRNRRYHIWYNEIGSGASYPDTYRIYDARFKRWMERPINSALSDNFGYPALLNYSSWELYNASSRTNYVYELETEDNSDEGEKTEAVYTTKNFSSQDFAVASGGQFPIDDCRMKLLKLTITYFGAVGAIGFYWSADRSLHTGSKTIDLTQTGDLLNSSFTLNSSLMNSTPQEKTKTYTFPNDAVGKRFYFQITNSGTSTRPKIKKIKVSALAFPEP